MNVVEFAYQIVEMHTRIQELEEEVRHLQKYRRDYAELLNSNIEHNQHMMAGLLQIVLTPGVTDAMTEAEAQRQIKPVL